MGAGRPGTGSDQQFASGRKVSGPGADATAIEPDGLPADGPLLVVPGPDERGAAPHHRAVDLRASLVPADRSHASVAAARPLTGQDLARGQRAQTLPGIRAGGVGAGVAGRALSSGQPLENGRFGRL
jgi:hypothetical protein